MPEIISAAALAEWLSDDQRAKPLLLDVREINEVEICQLPNSLHMAMNTVPTRLNELDPEAEIVCVCHHGARSMHVANFLKQHGFDNVINLTGGIHAWATQVDQSMPIY
jgi:rhodanese-related sulfurtransferase